MVTGSQPVGTKKALVINNAEKTAAVDTASQTSTPKK